MRYATNLCRLMGFDSQDGIIRGISFRLWGLYYCSSAQYSVPWLDPEARSQQDQSHIAPEGVNTKPIHPEPALLYRPKHLHPDLSPKSQIASSTHCPPVSPHRNSNTPFPVKTVALALAGKRVISPMRVSEAMAHYMVEVVLENNPEL